MNKVSCYINQSIYCMIYIRLDPPEYAAVLMIYTAQMEIEGGLPLTDVNLPLSSAWVLI